MNELLSIPPVVNVSESWEGEKLIFLLSSSLSVHFTFMYHRRKHFYLIQKKLSSSVGRISAINGALQWRSEMLVCIFQVFIAQVFIVMFSVAIPGVPLDISDFFFPSIKLNVTMKLRNITFVDKMV